MHTLLPLTVAVPLITAAALAATNKFLPRPLTDALSLGCALAVTVMCALIAAHAGNGITLYWFSGFRVHGGIAVGIAFAADRFGAGMATLVGVMVSAALIYSLRYFEEVGSLYGSLMLAFLAGMIGFALTGDLFNLFVFFELMSVAGYALTAYKIEEAGPLQGAINFAITNSIGSFAMLTGIALLYGQTGALNMAQLGQALSAHPPHGLVTVAFLLIMGGLLVKAAIVPVHFWLADAHAVAPVPVCVLFSGVMVELPLYGLARIYWSVFSGPLGGHAEGIRATLIALGVITTLVGAAMCLAQRHLKRLLAFSTISHTGMFLIGFALLAPDGLAASAQYVIAHAFLKGSLFMAAGLLLHRFADIDEHRLRGCGRRRSPGMITAGAVFAIGGLGLSALPPLGAFSGKSALEEALAHATGYSWAIAVLIIGSALTGGAVLRATGRIFMGWGAHVPHHHQLATETSEQPETLTSHGRTPAVMAAPAAVLVVAGMVVGLFGPLKDGIAGAAARLTDRATYAAHVLGGSLPAHVPAPPSTELVALDYVLGAISVLGALAVAAVALSGRPLANVSEALAARASRAILALRLLHSGRITDYIAWLVAGFAVIGGALALS